MTTLIKAKLKNQISKRSLNHVIAEDIKSCTYSLSCTVRTSRQRSCNQRVGCLQQLGSRAFGLAKRSEKVLINRPLKYESKAMIDLDQRNFG